MIAEAFPVGDLLQEEMDARGWDAADIACRMGGETVAEMAKDYLIVQTILAVRDPRLRLDDKSGHKLGRAFGVDEDFFLNLDKAYRAAALPEEK